MRVAVLGIGTMGHAVGAGISIASGIVSWFCFTDSTLMLFPLVSGR